MELQPCSCCPNFTYSLRKHDGKPMCDRCLDALTYVQKAPVDELRDLITNPTTPERTD